LWKETEVGSIYIISRCEIDESKSIDLIFAYIWRYVTSISDNAEKNFIWVKSNDSVISVDEDSIFRDSDPSPLQFVQAKEDIILSHIKNFFDQDFKERLQSFKEEKARKLN
jgi:hypothetical protein